MNMGIPSSSAPSLEGKIREPISSDDEEDEEEAENEEVEATNEVATSTPAKKKHEAVTKTPTKRAKTPTLVQSKLTTMVNPTTAKATTKKSPVAKGPKEFVDLSESSDESSDDLPRLNW
jgi:FtsZ-interacting cell division protein YlmF